jgi:tripartite ATP-independent transporter DctM subunit
VSDLEIGALSIFGILILVYSGVHIAIAMALLSFGCMWLVRDFNIAGKMAALASTEALQRYEFGVIPLFVLMGQLVSISDIGRDTYDVANHLFRHVRAGLGTATVAANAVFAAVTGTSIASASVFTKIAVPEMLRLGYQPRFAVGVVAGSSVLGMLIPPSLLLILFGILAETSIGDLFIAGIVPGIILALAYIIQIWLMARFRPEYVQSGESLGQSTAPTLTRWELFTKSAPIVILIGLVLGGIYGGVFTATEAGGVGAMAAFILTLLRRKLTFASLWRVLVDTGYVTAAISFLLIAANLYSRMIAATGIPNQMESVINHLHLGFYGLMSIYLVVIILMGTILDSGSIMLITVPIIVPALASFDVDLIWLGVVTIIAVEVGLLTPPFGVAVFVVQQNLKETGITLNDIFAGAAPFAVTMFVVLCLVTLFPQLALWLVYLK